MRKGGGEKQFYRIPVAVEGKRSFALLPKCMQRGGYSEAGIKEVQGATKVSSHRGALREKRFSGGWPIPVYEKRQSVFEGGGKEGAGRFQKVSRDIRAR